MIKITTDSTADLTKELYDEFNISVMPLIITYGNENFIDGEDIVAQDIFDRYEKDGSLPKTAARSPEDFKEFFAENLKGYDALIHFSISSEISSVYNNARMAAQEFDNVYVVDSRVLSTGIALLALNACDLAKKGLSAKEIYDESVRLTAFDQTSFVVDTLEFLYKGGRCSGMAAFASKLLNIKPILNLIDGKIEVCGKFMGKLDKKISTYTSSVFAKYPNALTNRIFITHAHADQAVVDAVKAQVLERFPDANIIETFAGSTVTSHCGKGTIGVLYLYY